MRAIFQAAWPAQAPFAPWSPEATLPGLAWLGSLGERAFGCGRWAVLAPLGISDCRSHISDLRFEICHLKSQKGTSAASLALPSASPLRVRGLAEQAESTESERFKEPTGPLLSAREVSPRTGVPDEEALKRRDWGGSLLHLIPCKSIAWSNILLGIPKEETMFRRIDHVALHVSDLERSVSFYENHFGFKKYFQHAATGGG